MSDSRHAEALLDHGSMPEGVREVFEADDARHRAMVAHDLDALGNWLADELVYTHATARRETKAEYLHSLTRGRVRYLGVQRSDATVQLYGGAALMIGRSEIRAISEGVSRVVCNLFQSVWVRSASRWRMVAWTSVLDADRSEALSALPVGEARHA